MILPLPIKNKQSISLNPEIRDSGYGPNHRSVTSNSYGSESARKLAPNWVSWCKTCCWMPFPRLSTWTVEGGGEMAKNFERGATWEVKGEQKMEKSGVVSCSALIKHQEALKPAKICRFLTFFGYTISHQLENSKVLGLKTWRKILTPNLWVRCSSVNPFQWCSPGWFNHHVDT